MAQQYETKIPHNALLKCKTCQKPVFESDFQAGKCLRCNSSLIDLYRHCEGCHGCS